MKFLLSVEVDPNFCQKSVEKINIEISRPFIGLPEQFIHTDFSVWENSLSLRTDSARQQTDIR